MKNFVKHIFAVAICAAALLSSCIKEPEYIRSTAELSVSLTGIEDTRSETQGNLIQDAWIWAYQCTINETRNTIVIDNDAVPVGSRYVYGLNSYDNISVHLPLPACSETDGTPVPQSYLLVAVINTEAYGELNLSANSTWGTVKNATFAQAGEQAGDFWDAYPKENAPQVMPISNWTTFTVKSANTHSSGCYQLNLPVYRAVAKTQLYMSKAGDFDLQVLDAQVVANTEYSQGMLLTGNKNSSVLDADGNPTSEVLRGDNGEKVQQGMPSEEADPWWWDASPAVKATDKGYQLKNNSESGFTTATIKTLGSATNPKSGNFTWVASTFLLENDNEAAYGVGAYDRPQGEGYNLRVTYKVGEGEPVVVYTPLGKVARNHDYKVYATVNAGGEMIFNIVVNEWLVEEQVLNYQDIATVTTDGYIKWSNLPGLGVLNDRNDNGQVEKGEINLTAAKGSSATFTFTLATPVTGYWIAELRTVMGDAGDIVFDDGSADGKTVLEGPIDNVENKITIKNLSENLAQSGGVENRVTLHIYAKAYWGDVLRSYRVDGIVGPDMTTDYTIVQPTQ